MSNFAFGLILGYLMVGQAAAPRAQTRNDPCTISFGGVDRLEKLSASVTIQPREAEQPANEAERELVRMARHNWLSRRATRHQEHCFQVSRTEENLKEGTYQAAMLKDLDLYMRYQVHNDRAYARRRRTGNT